MTRILFAAFALTALIAPAQAQVRYETTRTVSGATYQRLEGVDLGRQPDHFQSAANGLSCLTEKSTQRTVCHSMDEWRAIAARMRTKSKAL